jgi:hypothetical protein
MGLGPGDPHRSADILSATVRATSCRLNSEKQTADRMSAPPSAQNARAPSAKSPPTTFAIFPKLNSAPHRSADILSATVRATFCRPSSEKQTADRMSACRQRAGCTRSVGQIPSHHLRHFPQAQFRAPPERRYSIGYRARDILSPEFRKANCGQNVCPTQRAECTRSCNISPQQLNRQKD